MLLSQLPQGLKYICGKAHLNRMIISLLFHTPNI